jgi:mono/diheme cytochrome c family protein
MGRIRAFVGAVVVVGIVFTVGCGGREPTPPAGLDETQLAGWQAYVDLNCASCHGGNREGQRSGPALTGLADHWTADQLVDYLADPDAVVNATPRLAYKAEKYSIGMPSASAKSPGYATKARAEKLEALAEYLLVDPAE